MGRFTYKERVDLLLRFIEITKDMTLDPDIVKMRKDVALEIVKLLKIIGNITTEGYCVKVNENVTEAPTSSSSTEEPKTPQ